MAKYDDRSDFEIIFDYVDGEVGEPRLAGVIARAAIEAHRKLIMAGHKPGECARCHRTFHVIAANSHSFLCVMCYVKERWGLDAPPQQRFSGVGSPHWKPEPPPSWDDIIRAYEEYH